MLDRILAQWILSSSCIILPKLVFRYCCIPIGFLILSIKFTFSPNSPYLTGREAHPHFRSNGYEVNTCHIKAIGIKPSVRSMGETCFPSGKRSKKFIFTSIFMAEHMLEDLFFDRLLVTKICFGEVIGNTSTNSTRTLARDNVNGICLSITKTAQTRGQGTGF